MEDIAGVEDEDGSFGDRGSRSSSWRLIAEVSDEVPKVRVRR